MFITVQDTVRVAGNDINHLELIMVFIVGVVFFNVLMAQMALQPNRLFLDVLSGYETQLWVILGLIDAAGFVSIVVSLLTGP
jgi:hypothetical protein